MAPTQRTVERFRNQRSRHQPARSAGGDPSGWVPAAVAGADLLPAGGQVLHRVDGVPDRPVLGEQRPHQQRSPGGRGVSHPHGHRDAGGTHHASGHRHLRGQHGPRHPAGDAGRRLGGSLAQAPGDGGLQCHARPAGAVGTVLLGAGPVVSRFELGVLGSAGDDLFRIGADPVLRAG